MLQCHTETVMHIFKKKVQHCQSCQSWEQKMSKVYTETIFRMGAWFLACREETSQTPYWAGVQDWPGQGRRSLCAHHNTEQLYLGQLIQRGKAELWGDDSVQFLLLGSEAALTPLHGAGRYTALKSLRHSISWWVQAQKRGSVVCLLL